MASGAASREVRSPSSPQESSFPGSSDMKSNTELEREAKGAEGIENVSGGRTSEESNFPAIGEDKRGGEGTIDDNPESKYRGSSLVRHRNISFPIPSAADCFLTDDDYDEIYRIFAEAPIIQEAYPFCVIGGATPPESPVSVKGLITEFWDNIREFPYVPCDLGNPTLPDPMSSRIDF